MIYNDSEFEIHFNFPLAVCIRKNSLQRTLKKNRLKFILGHSESKTVLHRYSNRTISENREHIL